MRSRFFGATSYDDEDDDDYEPDLSGFVSDMNPPKPPVVERARSKRASSEASAHQAPNLGVPAGPRPINMGYAPSPVVNAAANTGSPFNPVWAHDESLIGKKVVVGSKVLGASAMMVSYGIAQATGNRRLGILPAGMPGVAFLVGHQLYMMPALGWNNGFLNNKLGESSALVKVPGKLLTHAALLGMTTYFIKKNRGN
jgi:hypothetical protein